MRLNQARLRWLALAMSGLAAVSFAASRSSAKASTKACPTPSISKVRWSFQGNGAGFSLGNFWVSYNAQEQTGTVYVRNDDPSDAGSGTSDFIFPTRLATTAVGSSQLGFSNNSATVSVGVTLKCGAEAIERQFRIKVGQSGQKLFDVHQSSWCSDYAIIDSRGSGEPAGQFSGPGARFIDRFEQLHDGANFQVVSNPYPAAGSLASMLLAWAKLPFGAYHRSVVSGKNYLRGLLKQAERECPDTPIYMVGYSQGAQVVGDVYQTGKWPPVQGVALFGDPYFNPNDRSVDRGGFSTLQHGILGTRPRFPIAAKGVVLSYCHARDPVCQGVAANDSPAQHKNYGRLGDAADQAAERFALAG